MFGLEQTSFGLLLPKSTLMTLTKDFTKSTARPARRVGDHYCTESIWDYSDVFFPLKGDLVTFKSCLWGYNVGEEGFVRYPSNTAGKFIDTDPGCVCLDIFKLDLTDQNFLPKDFDYSWCFYFLIGGEVYCVYEWDYQIAMGEVVQSVSKV